MNRRRRLDDDPPPSEAALEAAANMQAAIHDERLRTHATLKGIGPGPTMQELRTRGDRWIVKISIAMGAIVLLLFFAGVFGFVFGLVSQN
ncbi:hypothetical protein [Roseiterribacter gracilis]|uniref:Uncharacterized protein n=1 Tax=Roseiterribacter gracilis TaxID=2812848 RepID=A0A8S8X5P1_9PROT|nr:hypothetical protein TMPK1_01750 [Rhodospirillales bacterium TMPK1]